jgi:hypothetical protein
MEFVFIIFIVSNVHSNSAEYSTVKMYFLKHEKVYSRKKWFT